MEKFNLEQARNGRPVVTRSGNPARIIDFEKNDNYSDFHIVALVTIKDDEVEYRYNNEGKLYNDKEDSYDLMMAEMKDITKPDNSQELWKSFMNSFISPMYSFDRDNMRKLKLETLERTMIMFPEYRDIKKLDEAFKIAEKIYNWTIKTN